MHSKAQLISQPIAQPNAHPLASKLAPHALAFVGIPSKELLDKPATLEYVRERSGGGRPSSVDMMTKVEAMLMREKKIGYFDIQDYIKQKKGVSVGISTIEKWKRSPRVIKALNSYKEAGNIPLAPPKKSIPGCPLDIKVEAVTMMQSGASLKMAQNFVTDMTATKYPEQTIYSWKYAKKVKEELNKLTKH